MALWLHSAHGQPGAVLNPLLAPRGSCDSFPAANAFAASTPPTDECIGASCQILGQDLCAGQQYANSVLASLFLAHVSWVKYPTPSYPDMVLISVVPRGESCLQDILAAGAVDGGYDGTGTCELGWFVLTMGGSNAEEFMVLDQLSLGGVIRNDVSIAFGGGTNEVLGEGTYATVHSTQDQLGNPVALKQMFSHVEHEAVEREINTLIAVQPHPNIVRYCGLFVDWTSPENMVLSVGFELAGRGDLLYRVLQVGVLTEEEARPIFTGILSALAHLEAHSIVHRDVKAENVLLKTDEHAIIADFGLATYITDTTQMSRRCGSPGYVAPEVCLGTPYDYKVDTFGAGVVLYFLLSKEMPFSSPDRDTAATMRRTVKCSLHLHRPPWEAMASSLRNILRQLICRDQELRMSAASALNHAWIKGRAGSSTPADPTRSNRAYPAQTDTMCAAPDVVRNDPPEYTPERR